MPETLAAPLTKRAWEHTAPDEARFTIRPAASLADLEACIVLQQETWGYSDLEVVPRNIYVLAQALGGHVLCAWDSSGLFAGFAMAIAAHEPDASSPAWQRWMQPVGAGSAAADGERSGEPVPPEPYLHSHLVAIAPRYRSAGLGSALKLAQREVALSAGVRCMRWTFDPLMARNAVFNLNRLGATVQRYIPDFYGTLNSALQGGVPTDRFVAEWALTGPRLEAARSGRLRAPHAALAIPLSPDIAKWKTDGYKDALLVVQAQLREQFTDAFARGLQVQWFAPDGRGGGSYLLAEP